MLKPVAVQRLQSDRLELRANVLRRDVESAHAGLAPFERVAREEVDVRCDGRGSRLSVVGSRSWAPSRLFDTRRPTPGSQECNREDEPKRNLLPKHDRK